VVADSVAVGRFNSHGSQSLKRLSKKPVANNICHWLFS